MDEAKASLINEAEAALNWIEANDMIANPEKFHPVFLSPKCTFRIFLGGGKPCS